MRYLTMSAVVVGLFVVGVGRADEAAARKVIEKAMKAHGIKDGKQPAVTWKGKGTFYGMGDGLPYEGNWSEHLPDKFRMEINNAFTIIVNGDQGWLNGQEMTKEQLAEQREGMHASWVMGLHPLANKSFTLESLGESKVEDKPALGVKVSHKGRRDVRLFFDKDSGMLVKVEQTVKDDQSGAELKQESIVKEYATVGEMKAPSKMIIKRDGKRYVDGEMLEYKVSEKLPDGTFAKP